MEFLGHSLEELLIKFYEIKLIKAPQVVRLAGLFLLAYNEKNKGYFLWPKVEKVLQI